MRVDWYDQQIENIVLSAWESSMTFLQQQMIIEFTSNKWDWPSGQSPRDIVDSNNLRGQTLSAEQAKVNARTFLWTWNAEYALAVHNGATFVSGPLAGRVFPARPWTKLPLSKLSEHYRRKAQTALRAMP